jgi:hypothetical protein
MFDLPEELTTRQMIAFERNVRKFADRDVSVDTLARTFGDFEASEIALKAAVTAKWFGDDATLKDVNAIDDMRQLVTDGIACIKLYGETRLDALIDPN